MTICGLLLLDSDAPGTSSAAPPASWVDIGDGQLAPKAQSAILEGSDDGSQASTALRLSQSLRGLLLTNKAQTASTALAHVASLLCLLSSILDIPLRYPILPSVRTQIYDPIMPDLSEVERRFVFLYVLSLFSPDFHSTLSGIANSTDMPCIC